MGFSAILSVSQGCRSYTPPLPPQRALSHPVPDLPVALILALGRGGVVLPPPKSCHAPGGGAATLASVALHFDTKSCNKTLLRRVPRRFFQIGP